MLVFLLTWVRGDIIGIPKGMQGHISLFPVLERIFLKIEKAFSTSSQPVEIIHRARNVTGSHLPCWSGSPTFLFILGAFLSLQQISTYLDKSPVLLDGEWKLQLGSVRLQVGKNASNNWILICPPSPSDDIRVPPFAFKSVKGISDSTTLVLWQIQTDFYLYQPVLQLIFIVTMIFEYEFCLHRLITSMLKTFLLLDFYQRLQGQLNFGRSFANS